MVDFATNTCKHLDIPVEKSGSRRFKKMMPGENARDEGLSLQQDLRRCIFECIDKFYQELTMRSASMETMNERFAAVQLSLIHI